MDVRILTLKEKISSRSGKHLNKLEKHENPEAQRIVMEADVKRRLKRVKFSDLPTRSLEE